MRDDAEAARPGIAAETTWGTPALDLPGTARGVLADRGVDVTVLGPCTRCASDRFFSHRADPDDGRQAGVVVRLDGDAA